MYRRYYIIFIFLLYSLSCISQSKTARITLSFVNYSLTETNINVEFIAINNQSKVTLKNSSKIKLDTILNCNIVYRININSDGFYSQSIKFYNNNCIDTTLNIELESNLIVQYFPIIYFKKQDAEVDISDVGLKEIKNILLNDDNLKLFNIIGYRTNEEVESISLERAKKVKSVLIEMGIKEKILNIIDGGVEPFKVQGEGYFPKNIILDSNYIKTLSEKGKIKADSLNRRVVFSW